MHARSAVLLGRHPLWLDALEHMLARVAVRSLAKTDSPEEALALVFEHHPDVFVLDVEAADGAQAFACVRAACAETRDMRVVVVSASDDPQRVEDAFASGASAYVLKRAPSDDIASAIRQLFDTSIFYSATRVTATQIAIVPDAEADLTRREREILAFVAEGRTNREVAKLLWVTEQTVKFHLANVYRKLGVANRTQASRWAHSHGLVNGARRAEDEPVPVVLRG